MGIEAQFTLSPATSVTAVTSRGLKHEKKAAPHARGAA